MTQVQKERRLTRLGAELLIIVVGVLIALWVDSAGEARRDDASRAYLLESLHAEAVANLDALRSVCVSTALRASSRTRIRVSRATRHGPVWCVASAPQEVDSALSEKY